MPALQTEGTKENCVSSEKRHLIILCLMVSMTRALLISRVDLSRPQVPASLLSLHFCFSEVCPGCTPLPIALWLLRGHLQTALLQSECFLWGVGGCSLNRGMCTPVRGVFRLPDGLYPQEPMEGRSWWANNPGASQVSTRLHSSNLIMNTPSLPFFTSLPLTLLPGITFQINHLYSNSFFLNLFFLI